MTTTKELAQVVLGSGSDAVTVHTEICEEVKEKDIKPIKYPSSSANWSSGPKSTKIIDLLKVSTVYSVDGYIDSADESKFRSLMTTGGVFNMTWKGSDFNVNMQKYAMTNGKGEEQDETRVKFSVIAGENL